MDEGDKPAAAINDYRDLTVWKEAMDLAIDIYRLTDSFPTHEMFGLTSQMRRAAVSIPSNIAEGFGRPQRQSFIRFLRIAQGSLKELETQTLLSRRIGMMDEGEGAKLDERYRILGKRLRSFILSLERGRSGK